MGIFASKLQRKALGDTAEDRQLASPTAYKNITTRLVHGAGKLTFEQLRMGLNQAVGGATYVSQGKIDLAPGYFTRLQTIRPAISSRSDLTEAQKRMLKVYLDKILQILGTGPKLKTGTGRLVGSVRPAGGSSTPPPSRSVGRRSTRGVGGAKTMRLVVLQERQEQRAASGEPVSTPGPDAPAGGSTDMPALDQIENAEETLMDKIIGVWEDTLWPADSPIYARPALWGFLLFGAGGVWMATKKKGS